MRRGDNATRPFAQKREDGFRERFEICATRLSHLVPYLGAIITVSPHTEPRHTEMASSTMSSIAAPRAAPVVRSNRAPRGTVAMARAGRRPTSGGRRATTLNRRREDARRRSEEERAPAPPLESMREVLALLATLELGAPTAASEDDPGDNAPGVYLARRWSDGRASFGASTDLAKTFETMRADWGDVEMIHAVVPDEANRTSLVERLGKRMKSMNVPTWNSSNNGGSKAQKKIPAVDPIVAMIGAPRPDATEMKEDTSKYPAPYAGFVPPEVSKEVIVKMPSPGAIEDIDERLWVPQTADVSFRPLLLNVSQGYYVNLLRVRGGGGVLSRHRHPGPVHGWVLKGRWRYLEHDWVAEEGSYVFEPPGETHTLVVPDGVEEMITMFNVTGPLLYCDEEGKVVNAEDVFDKLALAKAHYEKVGLGADYVDQFVR